MFALAVRWAGHSRCGMLRTPARLQPPRDPSRGAGGPRWIRPAVPPSPSSWPRPGTAAPAVEGTTRIVVGAAPGGGADILGRLPAEPLSGRYATQVIVLNRPGASSRSAIEVVKAAPPDGTTVLLRPMPVLTLFPHVLPRTTRYDTLADFTPVTTIGGRAYGFAVQADHPARDLPGFIAWARDHPGASFAPPVLGAPQHMLGLAFVGRPGSASPRCPTATPRRWCRTCWPGGSIAT